LQTSDSARVEIAQQVAEELKDVIIPEAKSHWIQDKERGTIPTVLTNCYLFVFFRTN
jgi:hypothetical protein